MKYRLNYWLLPPLLLASSLTAAAPVYAPYVDMTLWPTPNVDQIGVRQGISQFTLAFIVTGSGNCVPSWGGVQDVEAGLTSDLLTAIASSIDKFRTNHGEIAISFGGANGLPLAQSCTSVDGLVNAYQSVIDTYDLTHIDFDIEGSAQQDSASIERNFHAVKRLQQQATAQGKALHVSLTLPTMESGLTQDGLDVVRSALNHRVAVDTVNLMTMDYGHPVADMGAAAIQAAQAVHGQLNNLYQSLGKLKTSRQLWRMIGITPMIGVNDSAGETFSLNNARSVSAFARSTSVGFLSMWSVARDKACPGGPSPWASSDCSGINQGMGAFAKLLKTKTAYWGQGVVQNPDYGTGPTGTGEWSSAQIYLAGDAVTYNNATYIAKWWTQGDIPGQTDVWVLVVK
ncbi:MAG: chitinase [Methylovulum sp.]|nr:chitinase [Methylovulum sp.]